MKKILTAATSALMFLFVGSSAVIAQEEEDAGPATIPVETRTCNFREGKGREDLDAVIAEWNDWMDDEGRTDYFAAVVTPSYYAEWPFDIAWLGAWSDGNAMGAGTDHWIAEGGEMADKFIGVLDCNSHTMFASMNVKEPPENDDKDDNTFVLAFSNCSIKEGKTFEDYMAAQTEWNAYADENGFVSGGWVMWPIWGEDVDADYNFKYLGSADDYTGLGANFQLMAEGHWRKSSELFDDLVDCDSGRIYSATAVRRMAEDDD